VGFPSRRGNRCSSTTSDIRPTSRYTQIVSGEGREWVEAPQVEDFWMLLFPVEEKKHNLGNEEK